jgi:NADP-dependent 3-hydroxy acid dehydrogenase YdfG
MLNNAGLMPHSPLERLKIDDWFPRSSDQYRRHTEVIHLVMLVISDFGVLLAPNPMF